LRTLHALKASQLGAVRALFACLLGQAGASGGDIFRKEKGGEIAALAPFELGSMLRVT
jgi:hypothetical protein